MTRMTVTEALSEVKLIEKKIAKKQETILQNLVRVSHIKDPLESQGGTSAYVVSEHQSIKDLQERLTKIRSAIADANLKTSVTVGETTKSLFEWLTWKREISEGYIKFLNRVHTTAKHEIDTAARSPKGYQTETGTTKLVELTPNVNYMDYVGHEERAQTILDQLDGQLSLKNATVVITI